MYGTAYVPTYYTLVYCTAYYTVLRKVLYGTVRGNPIGNIYIYIYIFQTHIYTSTYMYVFSIHKDIYIYVYIYIQMSIISCVAVCVCARKWKSNLWIEFLQPEGCKNLKVRCWCFIYTFIYTYIYTLGTYWRRLRRVIAAPPHKLLIQSAGNAFLCRCSEK